MDNKKQLHRLAAEVAHHLGEEWSAPGSQKHNYVVCLDGPNAARIAARIADPGGKQARVEIWGAWPGVRTASGSLKRFAPHGEKYQITCAISRGAEAIAKDIQRRLLPDFLPRWDLMCQHRDGFLRQEKVLARAIAPFAEIAGEKPQKGAYVARFYQEGGPYGSVEVSTYRPLGQEPRSARRVQETTAEIEIRTLPFAKALQVAHVAWGSEPFLPPEAQARIGALEQLCRDMKDFLDHPDQSDFRAWELIGRVEALLNLAVEGEDHES